MSANPNNVPFHASEIVDTDDGSQLDRIRVTGGWLYRAIEWNPDHPGATTFGVALCFVPDPPGRT
ncbi:hypothetical protein [Roseomonas indoligenes]|uniref:Uncharacterized protein n=1 Tax=Roseomonas indoligenes TaxID=2820811 RepID=A0A940MS51_9PROT|nr:hypothetical protein [Pararoseomonas indoligenes]MBP0493053.1 hypothetical protein [Pararoseomonas indoligenes]